MNKPFSPALKAAVGMLTQSFKQQLHQLVGEEAASLGLPEGTTADLQKMEWVAPEKKAKK